MTDSHEPGAPQGSEGDPTASQGSDGPSRARSTAGSRDDASEGIFGGRGWRPTEVSLLPVVNVLLEHRRSVLLIPVICVVLLLGYSVLRPPAYTSSATFTAQSDAPNFSQLSGLAAQIGISVPTSLGGGGQSPAFYADLLRSTNLLSDVVATDYRLPENLAGEDGPTSEDLVWILDIEGDTREEKVVNAVEALRNRMTTGTDLETGVVRVAVSTPWPRVSHQLVERLIDLVNRFNVERRRSQAEAERKFLESRVESARQDLQAAEDSLESFLERNRRYENSPRLRFDYQSLQRRVELNQQVFTSVAQSLEQAKMQEVRSTPVITVVEQPEQPVKPDGQSRVLLVLLGLLGGGVLAISWAFSREFFRATRTSEPDAYARFTELKNDAKQDLARLWRRLRPDR